MFRIISVEPEKHLTVVQQLFQEYAASIGFDLSFQDFKTELAELPGEYVPPDGRLLIAREENQMAGCVALKKISTDVCEMKRLYVRPQFQGKGIGRKLTAEIIKEARKIGYRYVRLDTVPSMKAAIGLYRSLGFRKIAPYRYNPIPGTLFMELELKPFAVKN